MLDSDFRTLFALNDASNGSMVEVSRFLRLVVLDHSLIYMAHAYEVKVALDNLIVDIVLDLAWAFHIDSDLERLLDHLLVHNLRDIVVWLDSFLVEIVAIGQHMVASLVAALHSSLYLVHQLLVTLILIRCFLLGKVLVALPLNLTEQQLLRLNYHCYFDRLAPDAVN